MATNYRYISAVGQINDMACWAACLKWWYKAEMSINASQTKLWERYKHLREPLGGMSDSGIEHIINENAMKCLVFQNASDFTHWRANTFLDLGPMYVAYSTTGSLKRHVNVLYDISGDGPWAEVRAMEPQAVEKGDGTWKGEHQKRSLSDYNMQGTIFAGIKRSKWEAYLAS